MTFYETLTAAVNDILEHGFDSQERVTRWLEALTEAARRAMMPARTLERHLKATLLTIYRRAVEQGTILQRHPGVSRFTLQHVAPRLRAELDRRLAASADLIVLDREKAIQDTQRRFAGWASSVPAGGSDAQTRTAAKAPLRKALASLPFVERRVIIDQGHKFSASLNDLLAQDAGALAAVWHSHWRQKGYDYREDHKERDERVYAIKGSWAQARGLVKAGEHGWLSDITQPGEEVFCRCYASYLYALGRLPDDMITAKGCDELRRVREAA